MFSSIPTRYSLYSLARHLICSLLSLMIWWANWTLEEKFPIRAQLCIIFYILNKDKMADLVIQPRGKILEKLPYSPNFNAWRGSIAQWSVFIRPYNHRLLTTEKVVDECKAIKLVNKCFREKCQKLELLDCEKVCVSSVSPSSERLKNWTELRSKR